MASSSAGRHPVITTLLVLFGLLLVGGGITYFATDHGKALLPTLEQPTLNISNISREKIQGQFAVKLHNHTPVDLKIDSLSYVTRVEGTRIAQGHKARPLVVKGNAVNDLTLPITLNLPQIKQELKSAQRDCVTVQMHTVLYANLPGIGPKEIPVDVRKRVYIPKLPKIEVADVDIDNLGLKKGEATVKLRVTNYESIPFTVKQVNYRFQIEDDLDVKGQETKDIVFHKKGVEIMPIHVRFQPKSMPKVLFKTLFKAKKTDYKLTGSATVAVGDAGAKDATMHFNSSGTVKDLKELAKAAKKDK
ncbi:MAG: LEA type 2 family protein [Janthinobacterium lividum]|jgi:LEA14-like dessication related protein